MFLLHVSYFIYCIKTTLQVAFTPVMDLNKLLVCAVVKFTEREVLLLNMCTEMHLECTQAKPIFNLHHPTPINVRV